MFGVEGIGEGIVWKAAASPFKSNLWFKVKGSEHVGSARNSGPKVVTNVCPERVQSMGACVDIVLTEGRLIQGLEYLKENNIAIEMSNLGAFLKWIGQDVVKEEADTISANGFTWKDVSPSITRRAKTFFTKSISSF